MPKMAKGSKKIQTAVPKRGHNPEKCGKNCIRCQIWNDYRAKKPTKSPKIKAGLVVEPKRGHNPAKSIPFNIYARVENFNKGLYASLREGSSKYISNYKSMCMNIDNKKDSLIETIDGGFDLNNPTFSSLNAMNTALIFKTAIHGMSIGVNDSRYDNVLPDKKLVNRAKTGSKMQEQGIKTFWNIIKKFEPVFSSPLFTDVSVVIDKKAGFKGPASDTRLIHSLMIPFEICFYKMPGAEFVVASNRYDQTGQTVKALNLKGFVSVRPNNKVLVSLSFANGFGTQEHFFDKYATVSKQFNSTVTRDIVKNQQWEISIKNEPFMNPESTNVSLPLGGNATFSLGFSNVEVNEIPKTFFKDYSKSGFTRGINFLSYDESQYHDNTLSYFIASAEGDHDIQAISPVALYALWTSTICKIIKIFENLNGKLAELEQDFKAITQSTYDFYNNVGSGMMTAFLVGDDEFSENNNVSVFKTLGISSLSGNFTQELKINEKITVHIESGVSIGI